MDRPSPAANPAPHSGARHRDAATAGTGAVIQLACTWLATFALTTLNGEAPDAPVWLWIASLFLLPAAGGALCGLAVAQLPQMAFGGGSVATAGGLGGLVGAGVGWVIFLVTSLWLHDGLAFLLVPQLAVQGAVTGALVAAWPRCRPPAHVPGG